MIRILGSISILNDGLIANAVFHIDFRRVKVTNPRVVFGSTRNIYF